MRIDAGSVDELQKTGRLLAKIGSQPVCVLWDGTAAYAVDDRCPHLGFPLHRGTVEQGSEAEREFRVLECDECQSGLASSSQSHSVASLTPSPRPPVSG